MRILYLMILGGFLLASCKKETETPLLFEPTIPVSLLRAGQTNGNGINYKTLKIDNSRYNDGIDLNGDSLPDAYLVSQIWGSPNPNYGMHEYEYLIFDTMVVNFYAAPDGPLVYPLHRNSFLPEGCCIDSLTSYADLYTTSHNGANAKGITLTRLDVNQSYWTIFNGSSSIYYMGYRLKGTKDKIGWIKIEVDPLNNTYYKITGCAWKNVQ